MKRQLDFAWEDRYARQLILLNEVSQDKCGLAVASAASTRRGLLDRLLSHIITSNHHASQCLLGNAPLRLTPLQMSLRRKDAPSVLRRGATPVKHCLSLFLLSLLNPSQSQDARRSRNRPRLMTRSSQLPRPRHQKPSKPPNPCLSKRLHNHHPPSHPSPRTTPTPPATTANGTGS